MKPTSLSYAWGCAVGSFIAIQNTHHSWQVALGWAALNGVVALVVMLVLDRIWP